MGIPANIGIATERRVFFRPILSARCPNRNAPKAAPIHKIEVIKLSWVVSMGVSRGLFGPWSFGSTGDVHDRPIPAFKANKSPKKYFKSYQFSCNSNCKSNIDFQIKSINRFKMKYCHNFVQLLRNYYEVLSFFILKFDYNFFIGLIEIIKKSSGY